MGTLKKTYWMICCKIVVIVCCKVKSTLRLNISMLNVYDG